MQIMSEDLFEYQAPYCELVLYAVQNMISGSSTSDEDASLDPFIGGGDYEW